MEMTQLLKVLPQTLKDILRYIEMILREQMPVERGVFHFTPPADGVILFEYLNSDASADGVIRLESDVGGVRLRIVFWVEK